MNKPNELRAHLARWLPDLARNPEKLHIVIPRGSIAAKAGNSHSFEYRYKIEILITDFAEPTDTIIVPLLVWIAENQPDLLRDPEKSAQSITFEAEIIDHDKVDMLIAINLSERVVVSQADDGFSCKHVGEPQSPDLGGPTGWSIYINGQLNTDLVQK